jgi:hypothetical protein
MFEHLAVCRQEAGDTIPIQGRVYAMDAKGRAGCVRSGVLSVQGLVLFSV